MGSGEQYSGEQYSGEHRVHWTPPQMGREGGPGRHLTLKTSNKHMYYEPSRK